MSNFNKLSMSNECQYIMNYPTSKLQFLDDVKLLSCTAVCISIPHVLQSWVLFNNLKQRSFIHSSFILYTQLLSNCRGSTFLVFALTSNIHTSSFYTYTVGINRICSNKNLFWWVNNVECNWQKIKVLYSNKSFFKDVKTGKNFKTDIFSNWI